jgi:hypothetical protein
MYEAWDLHLRLWQAIPAHGRGIKLTFIPGQTMVTYDPGKDWKQEYNSCPKCGVAGQWYWRIRTSSDGAYDDEENECRACGAHWWVDGSDS